jgi:hypothetical protein
VEEPKHLVHWAGIAARAGSVIRQRCCWCGALIEEIDLERIAVQTTVIGGPAVEFVDAEGKPKDRWQGLVAISEGFPTVKWAVDEPADGKIPADSCMALDVAVTA